MMSIIDKFQDLEKKHPERKPGSLEASLVAHKIKEQTNNWNYNSSIHSIPVFNLKISIWLFIAGSALAILLSHLNPSLGLVLASLLWLLLISEPIGPILARLKPAQAENIQITIPARSKASREIVLVANFTTDNYASHSPKISNRTFFSIIAGLSLLEILLMVSALIIKTKILLLSSFLPLLGLIILVLLSKDEPNKTHLTNCSILLDLGLILAKARPSNTNVILYFSGANSLNSGILEIPKILKRSPERKYVVNLFEWPDKRINLVTTDQLLFPQPTTPILIEALLEVAREKAIPLQTIKANEITPAYYLKQKNIRAISVSNPLDTPNATKDLRELLIGLIRKIDQA